MKDLSYLFLVFLAMTAVTATERFLPFAAASWLSKQRWVKVVGSFLPLAIMVPLSLTPGAPGALLSIFCGTACYVVLLNSFFV